MKRTQVYCTVNDASSREPNIADVLNDPVVRAVMHADGVDPDELARILRIPIRGRSTMQQSSVGSRPIKHGPANMRAKYSPRSSRVARVATDHGRRKSLASTSHVLPHRQPPRGLVPAGFSVISGAESCQHIS